MPIPHMSMLHLSMYMLETYSWKCERLQVTVPFRFQDQQLYFILQVSSSCPQTVFVTSYNFPFLPYSRTKAAKPLCLSAWINITSVIFLFRRNDIKCICLFETILSIFSFLSLIFEEIWMFTIYTSKIFCFSWNLKYLLFHTFIIITSRI